MEHTDKEAIHHEAEEEVEAAEALVAPPREQKGVRRGCWIPIPEVAFKTTSFKVVSATTASLFLLILFVATAMYTHGIDMVCYVLS